MRFGTGPVWVAAIAVILTLNLMDLERPLIVVAVVWVASCVYSWIVPPLVRRLIRP